MFYKSIHITTDFFDISTGTWLLVFEKAAMLCATMDLWYVAPYG